MGTAVLGAKSLETGWDMCVGALAGFAVHTRAYFRAHLQLFDLWLWVV